MIEIKTGIYTQKEFQEKIKNPYTTFLKGKGNNVCVGEGFLVKVATNIGVSEISNHQNEINKLDKLEQLPYSPDIIMDHTIVKLKKPFWKTIVNTFSGPVGTLPHYLSYDSEKGICETEFLERLHEMAEFGVSFVTLHPTANEKLLEIAKKTRVLPTTARGGGIILSDNKINQRNENIISKNFDSILEILKKHNMAISIGTTFRPSNIFEALDEVHIEETKLQSEFVSKARERGVDTMMEGVGHIRLSQIQEYGDIIKKIKVPFMPLGPIPTDASISFDHVASAIGASHLGMQGVAKVFHSVTREEHTGNVPNFESIIEGLKSARVAAHSVNISLFPEYAQIDKNVALTRSYNKTCVTNQGLFLENESDKFEPGCMRCNNECPLTLKY
ncbi:hypothetical protein DF185_10730 [Marinifilum breve]|uniref:Phosphomethylpyrimidine synthase ThiC n=1 Tax=Marinifilum breve TaxID=2184082 RepID=A0A2V3ZZX7_9BACT|nr:phosphomethylpyrimidine synthase ThiC [Marinifilum breve]PXY01117.1 hypothetical protein DF185_10730 [Marinifilum breve]